MNMKSIWTHNHAIGPIVGIVLVSCVIASVSATINIFASEKMNEIDQDCTPDPQAILQMKPKH